MRVGITAGFVMVLVCMTAGAATSWEGIDWTGIAWDSSDNLVVGDTLLNVTGDGYLTVSDPSGGNYSTAHYNTPGTLRASDTPWIEFSFLDEGQGTAGTQIWIEDETQSSPGAGFWTQLGSWDTRDNYHLYYNDYDADNADGGGLDFSAGEFLDTGIARTAGEHTVLIGMRADGTVDYWLDDLLLLSTTDVTPNYFGDVYLAARNGTATFTSYATGTDYTAVVPEPATIGLAGLGLAAVALRRIRRRRG